MKRKYLFKSRKKLQQLSCVYNTKHKRFWKMAIFTKISDLRHAVTSKCILTAGIQLSWKQQLKLWKQKK